MRRAAATPVPVAPLLAARSTTESSSASIMDLTRAPWAVAHGEQLGVRELDPVEEAAL
jgi:hypothetical protein